MEEEGVWTALGSVSVTVGSASESKVGEGGGSS